MPIYHNLKLIFIHVPKNAGTLLTDFFAKAAGEEPDAPGHHPWHWYQQHYPSEFQQYTKVAVVRNPYDRFFSCYHYARMLRSHWHSPDGSTEWGVHQDYAALKDASPDEACRLLQAGLLQHPTWAAQSAYILDAAGRPAVNVLLRFEHLQQGLQQLCLQLGMMCPTSLPRVNVSERPAEDQLSPDGLRILQHVYQQDLNKLGYAFDIVSS